MLSWSLFALNILPQTPSQFPQPSRIARDNSSRHLTGNPTNYEHVKFSPSFHSWWFDWSPQMTFGHGLGEIPICLRFWFQSDNLESSDDDAAESKGQKFADSPGIITKNLATNNEVCRLNLAVFQIHFVVLVSRCCPLTWLSLLYF